MAPSEFQYRGYTVKPKFIVVRTDETDLKTFSRFQVFLNGRLIDDCPTLKRREDVQKWIDTQLDANS